jgi:hypothetical protein
MVQKLFNESRELFNESRGFQGRNLLPATGN